MNAYRNSRYRRGFTLIELLVVITIISVLAAMSFAAVTSAIKKARRTEGVTMAKSLTSALEEFNGEYGRIPDGFLDEFQTDESNAEFLQILAGQEQTGPEMQNPRGLTFFGGNEAKGKRGGLYYGQSNEVQALYDPFGQPYTVILNNEYEDPLEFSFGRGNQTVKLRGKNIAVYSPGADKELGTTDDIKSW